MNILVTGGAGFIGSNFIIYMLGKYKDISIINLDALTYAGNLNNLESIKDNPNYSFVKGDICDAELVDRIFSENNIQQIVHFAAESHVDRSIVEPDIFVKSNILGTQVLLDIAKKHWKTEPDNKYSKDFKADVKFVHVSTDEVYGSLGPEGLFTEEMNLSPNSPYSASKASSDLLVYAYFKTFGLPINITRCSNNYGPYQFPEKLIPLMINNALKGESLPVYGDGMQVRDWLYVEDHCSAIDTVRLKGVDGEVYNIGGNNEKANIEIVKLIINQLEKPEDLITYVKDRPGHDRRYAIDNTKITTTLGWSPAHSFDEGMARTINWYLDNMDWVNEIVSGDYQKYYNEMYG
ncbi:MAG: dTDP-glucose 4,6-dehydratase [Saccharofermentanales bacterium]|jgi:dTDP-glucose 4,6-dehydratase